ncbi:PREDICTED: pre-rRNA-processing protein TSR1 homolog [Nicrophorus vespilloides]|uniref:Pre-rRNA-processing protein TSR1 homolog n=1 Tax=Nicrophorus vespilloides TaxID=110193 RepID=A0ABM1MD17_NICVS|nr:PREDICTED: pre-rRNA-processing protein TSR1 homolog [Nicrophorus vespilloides]
MVSEGTQAHRAGNLKQSNKKFNSGRHHSKRSISISTKGKVNIKSILRKQKGELSKEQKRHQANQIRKNKRDEVLNQKRSIGGLDTLPFLVCVLPLHQNINPEIVTKLLTECDEDAEIHKSNSGVVHITLPRFKQRFAFIIPSLDNNLAILDTLKVCDSVLFIISTNAELEFGPNLIDDWGKNLLISSFSQGLPTPTVVVTDLNTLSVKKQNDQKQNINKMISKWLPDEKVITLDKSTDGLNVLRKIGNQKKRKINCDRRPHIYAESYEYIKDTEGVEGTLKVTGYLRGTALSVNDLVYIPGLGNFQMSQIDAPHDPFAPQKKSKSANSMEQEDTTVVRVLERADVSKQESLQSENVPDPLDAEQTWPTEDEIRLAQMEDKSIKVKKVPKGWSDYQAAWIPDTDAQDISDDDEDVDEEEEDDAMEAMSDEESEDGEEQDLESVVTQSEIAVNDLQYDQQLDLMTEQADLKKLKAAKLDKMFPDEIDTPQDVPARVRFQKYRGLESYRTSPWDPKENLPADYARIFQFQNFDHTKKRVLNGSKLKEGAMPGWFVTVHVKGVSQLLWRAFETTSAPVILIGMFPHEGKMSVVNVVLKHAGQYEQPIKSKERLIFQCGYRRFIVNPIFSQHTNGKKHKFERYFQVDSTIVATFYAPIQFPPAPVVCYKEHNGQLILVANGSLLSCNPDRIITKRIVLSGHPFKVHKRSAVVRFMFFNRDDIAYFKPCKLRTKHGRNGHIKEPLGTHGHMKCVFDGQLKSQDTVLLNLYKRIFPKWTYEECIVSCVDSNIDDDMEM